MTWTEAATEASKYGFNAYRTPRGDVQPLLAPFASRPGDWSIDGGRIISPLGPRLPLLRVMPEPDPQATILLPRPA